MGYIIDTPDSLRLGLEARRESFTIIANEWVEENEGKMWLASGERCVSIELELDQIEPLIAGLEALRDYIRQRGGIHL